jgi:hypothetical protein
MVYAVLLIAEGCVAVLGLGLIIFNAMRDARFDEAERRAKWKL